ncbi:conserved hypothetical protein [Listeria monocytogenes HPB2262]|nr:hypothetical protein LMOh7858_3107 [Listeria monocytogenes str. 4b H7858] [Listeria monocytogenes serotype 4b str. H7858]EEW17754.1 conserved hypothetical protein [Listeria monocytogenes FSL R2-503]EFF94458.1 conserved hypothetical protein [Listeria monocytogenes HPB2262]
MVSLVACRAVVISGKATLTIVVSNNEIKAPSIIEISAKVLRLFVCSMNHSPFLKLFEIFSIINLKTLMIKKERMFHVKHFTLRVRFDKLLLLKGRGLTYGKSEANDKNGTTFFKRNDVS